MNPLLIWKSIGPTARILWFAAAFLILVGAIWIAVGAPRVALARSESRLSELTATHESLLARLREAEASSEAKSEEVRAAYDDGVRSSSLMREKEIADAYKRGVATVSGVNSGAVRVREVWRERDCPAPTQGAGSKPVAEPPQVSGGRAEAIGNVLGEAGVWDATYAEAYRRLEAAQVIINSCFETPSR